MPRRKRMYLPEIPCHVVQRGNNREACFFDIQDYQFYLELLRQLLPRYTVSLHAYVLMTNHIHLLLTPSDTEGVSSLRAYETWAPEVQGMIWSKIIPPSSLN